MLLLATLEAGPAHGYAIIEKLRWRSKGAFDLPEGTVYPALHRLENAGLVKSQWSSETGRRRRVYNLTRKGKAARSERTAAWYQFIGAVDSALAGAP
jgi:DNA-binding PadR family transcriptional regulator